MGKSVVVEQGTNEEELELDDDFEDTEEEWPE